MLLLFFFDLISIFISFYLAVISRFEVVPITKFWATFVLLSVITFFVFLYHNLYDRKRYINETEIFIKTILSSFYAIILYTLFIFFIKSEIFESSRIVILLFFIYFLVINIIIRLLIAPFIFEKWFANKKRRRKVVVIADGEHKKKIEQMLLSHTILGFIPCKETEKKCTDTVFLWYKDPDIGTVYNKIKEALKKYSLVEAVIPAFQHLRMEPTWTKINGMPVWEFRGGNCSKFTEGVIRFIDIIISLFVIAFAGIPMLTVAFVIKIETGGPALFKQKRVGKDGKIFTFLKFRSMHNKASEEIHKEYIRTLINGEKKKGEIFKMEDDPRITRFGRFIRKTSIDELPQFFNVLKGDMSIVGPRPALPYEVEIYKEWHKDRLKIKPGITGSWQVFGRSSLPFDESVFLDLYYKENRSVMLNLYLFLKTIPKVLTSAGAE